LPQGWFIWEKVKGQVRGDKKNNQARNRKMRNELRRRFQDLMIWWDLDCVRGTCTSLWVGAEV